MVAVAVAVVVVVVVVVAVVVAVAVGVAVAVAVAVGVGGVVKMTSLGGVHLTIEEMARIKRKWRRGCLPGETFSAWVRKRLGL